jgi:hypothetical protein
MPTGGERDISRIRVARIAPWTACSARMMASRVRPRVSAARANRSRLRAANSVRSLRVARSSQEFAAAVASGFQQIVIAESFDLTQCKRLPAG